MILKSQGLLPVLVALLLSGCTAVKVVTHSTNSDPVAAPAGIYHLDPDHRSLIFDVDHLKFSRFVMRFDHLTAELDFNPQQPDQSRITAVIEAASVDSNVAALDPMVRGEAMLDAAQFPEIRFVSRSLNRIDKTSGEMTGDLTLHGQTRPITLTVTFNGGARNPLTGEDVLGFSANGTLDRSAFGLSTWYPAVGNEVRIRIEAEFAKQHAS